MAKKKSATTSTKASSKSKVRRLKLSRKKVASSCRILKDSLKIFPQNKKIFAGITIVYAFLSLALVRGFSSVTGLPDIKDALASEGGGSGIDTGISLLGNLFSSGNASTSATASVYQTILIVIMSLVVIWVLRNIYASDDNQKISLKDAFYKSSYPLIPFLLVIVVISLQLLPFVAGSTIYSLVLTSGLAVSVIEKLLWAGVFFGLSVWSLYLICGSVFALYIVTLPNITPLQAVRSAKDLVVGRRWIVMRKIVFLPIVLFVFASLIMLPLVLWLTVLAEWIFFVLGLFSLFVIHSYMYRLYRELL